MLDNVGSKADSGRASLGLAAAAAAALCTEIKVPFLLKWKCSKQPTQATGLWLSVSGRHILGGTLEEL